MSAEPPMMPDDLRIAGERDRSRERDREARRDDTGTPLRSAARLARTLNHRVSMDSLLASSLDALQEALDVRRTAVLLHDAAERPRVRDSRGLSRAFRDAVETFSPWRQQANDAEIVVGDLRSDRALEHLREAGRREGVARVVLLPLYLDDRLFGRLDIYPERSSAPSGDERASAEAIAHLLGLAIARKRDETGRRLLSRASEALGALLDVDATLAAVGRLAIETLADGCLIHLRSHTGKIDYAASVHRDPARAELIRRIESRYPLRLDSRVGPARAMRTGMPEVLGEVPAELVEQMAVDEEHLRLMLALEVTTAICVPLVARGRTTGALTLMGHDREQGFDDVDLQIVVELAGHAALALDNARLYKDELEARRLAESAMQRAERLRELTEALSGAHTRGQVAEAVLAQSLTSLAAAGGALALRTRDGTSQEIVAAVGYASHVVDRSRRFALDDDIPLARAMQTGEPLFGVAHDHGAPPAVDSGETRGPEAWVAIPLSLDGVITGALGLTFAPRRRLGADEWEYLHLLARQGAQAVERARLHDAEQRSRSEASAAQRRLLFLAEANALFASSLDYEKRLQQLARLAVESVADYCLLYLGDEMGELHRASAHIDPTREPLVKRVEEAYSPSPDNPHSLLARVLRTGRSVLVRELPPDFADRVSHDAETRDAVERLGARSAIVVPLIARGQVIGGGAFLSTRPDRLYEPADLAFAEELVRRAAVSVDNARLYRAALDANQSKANFLAVMSHELRTPLTAILGYAELLADEIMGPVNEQQRDQLVRIRASGAHLLSLIEEILAFARLEAGQETLRREPTEIRTLVEGTRILIEPLVSRKKLRYVVDVPPSPTVITTDAAKVRQILLNLLANAVKFTDGGTITLAVRVDGPDAVFSVSDTGIGIPTDHLAHIFEPFWQVEQAMTRRESGTGLGLSVARQLTKMLGGEIAVRSAVGEGSTFTVRLPIAETPAS